MRAWHFLPSTGRVRNTEELIYPGGRYQAKGPLVVCQNGMHGSRRALNALSYAPGPRGEATWRAVCETYNFQLETMLISLQ